MRMYPRHNSMMNRLVARSVTYALRDYGRKNRGGRNYSSNKVNTYANNNTNQETQQPLTTLEQSTIVIVGIISFMFMVILLYIGLGNR